MLSAKGLRIIILFLPFACQASPLHLFLFLIYDLFCSHRFSDVADDLLINPYEVVGT